jgi:hypothetical protein
MLIVRIEHSVPSFDTWKAAFDSDPADRKGAGVRQYQILRSAHDPNLVFIDLEFDEMAEAETFVRTMEGIWSGPGQSVMQNPQARIVEVVEAKET